MSSHSSLGFSIKRSWNDFFSVFHGGRRVAILTPARPAGTFAWEPALPWSVVLDPAAFPDVPATNLPWPLRNTAMDFNSFEDVRSFLGIDADQVAA